MRENKLQTLKSTDDRLMSTVNKGGVNSYTVQYIYTIDDILLFHLFEESCPLIETLMEQLKLDASD